MCIHVNLSCWNLLYFLSSVSLFSTTRRQLHPILQTEISKTLVQLRHSKCKCACSWCNHFHCSRFAILLFTIKTHFISRIRLLQIGEDNVVLVSHSQEVEEISCSDLINGHLGTLIFGVISYRSTSFIDQSFEQCIIYVTLLHVCLSRKQ